MAAASGDAYGTTAVAGSLAPTQNAPPSMPMACPSRRTRADGLPATPKDKEAVAVFWTSRHRDDVTFVLAIVLLAGAVFVFFKTFFDTNPDNLTTEILAALLGSILTVMITMLLIRRQGSIEQAQEGAATSKTKVFERKLDLFRSFIATYVQTAADGKLSAKELQTLEELALTIALFTKDVPLGRQGVDLGQELCRFVLQLQLFGLRTQLHEEDYPAFDAHLRVSDPPETRRLVSFVQILRLMKIELGIAQSESEEVDDSLLDLAEYEWTRRLQAYRGYRRRSGQGTEKP